MGPMVLTYHLSSIKALFQDDFPVHKVGYVSFQENNILPSWSMHGVFLMGKSM